MKIKNDFRVYEEKNRYDQVVWRIRTGGAKGDMVTACRTKEEADEQARLLNIDPYHFERGYTVADRIKAYDAHNLKHGK